jgi:hypothetical protein
MATIEDMDERFAIAQTGYGLPDMIVGGYDVLDLFNQFGSLQELAESYDELAEAIGLNLQMRQVVIYYSFARGGLTDEDRLYAREHFNVEDVYQDIQDLQEIRDRFMAGTREYNLRMAELEGLTELQFEIGELSAKKTYPMRSRQTHDALTEMDTVDVFNGLRLSSFIQIIVYCNPEGKTVYRASTEFPIRFDSDLTTAVFEPNTVSLLYEASKSDGYTFRRTTLDFSRALCIIEKTPGMYDHTEHHVKETISDYIELIANESQEITSGSIRISIQKDVPILDIYTRLILDPLMSYFVRIDEMRNPWCLKPTEVKAVYYHPTMYPLFDFLGVRLYPRVALTFKEQMIANMKNFYEIKFETSTPTIIQSMASNITRLMSTFAEGSAVVRSLRVGTFYTTIYEEIKTKTGTLLLAVTGASSSAGFTTRCPAEKQPIVITEEEVPYYEEYGRNVVSIENNDRTFYFTCMTDDYPYACLADRRTDFVSGIKQYPCCFADIKQCSKQKTDAIKTNADAKTTSAIKNYSLRSILDRDILADFIKTSFSAAGNGDVVLVGTCMFKNGIIQSLNDSFIGALVYATEAYDVYTGQNRKQVDVEKLRLAFADVRRRLIELPYDIYRQELYDVPHDVFIANMCDPDHYIDPYLYYRGLEELFGVSIIVFTSAIRRAHASSLAELESEIPSVEIPRCQEYHTRFRRRLERGLSPDRTGTEDEPIVRDRPIVCIYKNYGTSRAIGNQKNPLPSCELIGVDMGILRGGVMTAFPPENHRFSDRLWNHFFRCCQPLLFRIHDDDVQAYDDPFSKFAPDLIAERIGMEVLGQEIGANGKTELLIMGVDGEPLMNVRVPGIQPLMLSTDIPVAHSMGVADDFDGQALQYNGLVFYVRNNGLTRRANPVNVTDITDNMRITQIDDDGVWIPYLGMDKGFKILTDIDPRMKTPDYQRVSDIVNTQNDCLALEQIINWLWRSDVDENGDTQDFKDWFPKYADVYDGRDLGQDEDYYEPPIRSLNNAYLPTFETMEDRMEYANSLWPFVFHDDRIHVYRKFYNRFMNRMIFHDINTRFLLPDTVYRAPPSFITNLTPTEVDYTRTGGLIFTKREHLERWIRFTNREFFGITSLTNMNIINPHVFPQHHGTIVPYLLQGLNKKIYIVQNVTNNKQYLQNGNVFAIEIAYQWKNRKENIGPGAKQRTYPEGTPYVQYEIDETRALVATADHTNGGTDYLEIVRYPQGNYGALLELN